jgi:hypothetical protein
MSEIEWAVSEIRPAVGDIEALIQTSRQLLEDVNWAGTGN